MDIGEAFGLKGEAIEIAKNDKEVQRLWERYLGFSNLAQMSHELVESRLEELGLRDRESES